MRRRKLLESCQRVLGLYGLNCTKYGIDRYYYSDNNGAFKFT